MPVIRLQGEAEIKRGIYFEVDTDSTALGAGGMGQVYCGVMVDKHTRMRTPVAIKFLFDDLSEKAIERSRREAAVRIDNENLVKMYGFIETEEPSGKPHYHVVSELLEGVMLYDFLNGSVNDRNGEKVEFAANLYNRYTADRETVAGEIVTKVLSGVMALHDKGYIHRDIDPSNIMITADGKIKLIDYGICKQLTTLDTQDRQLTSAGQFMGKAAYASPELIVGDLLHQDETTDLYAIGILLFQLITGHLPFTGPDAEVLAMQMKKELPLKEIKNKQLRNAVSKATRKKQADRFQSAAEFRVALEKDRRTRHTGADTVVEVKSKESPVERIKKIPRKYLLISAGVVAACFIVALAIVFGGNSGSENAKATERPSILPASGFIIDSDKDTVVNYGGKEYKSAALLTKHASEMLGDSSKVLSAVGSLEGVVKTGFKSASDAAYLLSRVYALDLDGVKSEVVQKCVEKDSRKATEMVMLAAKLDSTNYKALYQLGESYFGGELFTGELIKRDLAKAADYYSKSLKYAREKGDSFMINKIESQLGTVESLVSSHAAGTPESE